jgi:hypothetical protein
LSERLEPCSAMETETYQPRACEHRGAGVAMSGNVATAQVGTRARAGMRGRDDAVACVRELQRVPSHAVVAP